MGKYGRPMKNESRRIPITVHVPMKMLEIVDEYVADYAKSNGISYSRSDFYNDAIVAFLKEKGIEN